MAAQPLKQTIRDSGMSFETTARLCGISFSQFSRIVNGKNLPSEYKRDWIERVLGCEIDWIATLQTQHPDADQITKQITRWINNHPCRADYIRMIGRIINEQIQIQNESKNLKK